MSILLAMLAAASVSGTPTAAEKAAVLSVMQSHLKDPASAQYRWLAKRPGGHYCGMVNAKNSYGGYIGFQPFALILDDKLGLLKPLPVVMLASGNPDDPMSRVVRSACTEHGFPID